MGPIFLPFIVMLNGFFSILAMIGSLLITVPFQFEGLKKYGDVVRHSVRAHNSVYGALVCCFHLQLLMKMETERQAYEFNTIDWIVYILKLNDFYK